MTTNVEHMIRTRVFYIHKMDHRDGTAKKSQWIISEEDERICFTRAYGVWHDSNYTCWGLHFDGGLASYLGISKASASGQNYLFVAKFIDSNQNSRWHGYPADHVSNQQDIPSPTVLKNWLDSELLRPSIIRKLSKGQKCRL